jgi:hypothetical protein
VFLAELRRKVPVNDDDLIPANLPRQALRNEFFALLAVGRQLGSWPETGFGEMSYLNVSAGADLPEAYFPRPIRTMPDWITVAVGTTIAGRPPHRSVRARLRIRLLPRMNGVEALVRIGMQNVRVRNPPVQQWFETFPSHLRALTATD